MTLTKDDARTAVEIGALATGSVAFAFPRLAARLLGAGGGDAEAMLVRMLGARSITYGALLTSVDSVDDDDVAAMLLVAGAASASADTVAALVGAVRGRRRALTAPK